MINIGPAPFIRRPRLTSALGAARIGVIEAAGGYGKSTLSREFRDELELRSVEVALPATTTAVIFVGRLVTALRRAGASDLATTVAGHGLDPDGAVEALLEALEDVDDTFLLILDEVHEADASTQELVLRLCLAFPEPHRLVVCGRSMPGSLARLRRDGVSSLVDGHDLLFTRQEVAQFLEQRLGRDPASAEVAALHAATGGWAAALVLSASLFARADDPEAYLQRAAARPLDLTRLVHESLRAVPEPERGLLVQLAYLPEPGPDLADALGAPRLLEVASSAGFPLTVLRDGRWSMPGPVIEALRLGAPLSVESASAASRAYLARNDIASAVRVLIDAGVPEAGAGTLAGLPPDRLDTVELNELEPIVESLPERALEAHPRVLLHLARALESSARTRQRGDVLDRLAACVTERTDPPLWRELQVEYARDRSRDGELDEAAGLATAALEAADTDEVALRARALLVLGRCASWHPEPERLAEAERLLTASLRLCRASGFRVWASHVTLPLAIAVQHALGHFGDALRTLDDGLSDLPAMSLQRAVVLTFRADVLVASGRTDEADADLDEAARVATLLGDDRAIAYANWERAKSASLRGDLPRVLDAIHTVERHPGDWYEHPTGAEFLADAADAVDRAGDPDLARPWLDRAMQRGAGLPETYAMPRANMAARQVVRGSAAGPLDATTAKEISGDLDTPDSVPPREGWRVAMIRAALALPIEGQLSAPLAVEAFDRAAALGIPELPLLVEPLVAERLLPLAIGAGSASAREAARRALSVSIRALGGFEVRRGRRLLELPAGKPEELVKLLVAEGGRAPTDEVIESLWPEVEDESGRKRLRNVLNRLREGAEDLVVRDGDTLALAADVEVDAIRFEAEARRAIHASADDRVTLARAALALERGTLLPDDRYASWAAAPRERVARRTTALLDLVIGDAQARGDLDEALRLLEQRIELDPYDEQPYLRQVRILLAQGRRGAARQTLERVRGFLDELGIPRPPALRDLERTLAV